MIHNKITKAGFQGAKEDGGLEMDYQDACDLLAHPAWRRYWGRKLKAIRDDLSKELETLKSCDVIEFKQRQAKIELLDEIVRIPEIDVKNLRR